VPRNRLIVLKAITVLQRPQEKPCLTTHATKAFTASSKRAKVQKPEITVLKLITALLAQAFTTTLQIPWTTITGRLMLRLGVLAVLATTTLTPRAAYSNVASTQNFRS
jgi:hypothetical protein